MHQQVRVDPRADIQIIIAAGKIGADNVLDAGEGQLGAKGVNGDIVAVGVFWRLINRHILIHNAGSVGRVTGIAVGSAIAHVEDECGRVAVHQLGDGDDHHRTPAPGVRPGPGDAEFHAEDICAQVQSQGKFCVVVGHDNHGVQRGCNFGNKKSHRYAAVDMDAAPAGCPGISGAGMVGQTNAILAVPDIQVDRIIHFDDVEIKAGFDTAHHFKLSVGLNKTADLDIYKIKETQLQVVQADAEDRVLVGNGDGRIDLEHAGNGDIPGCGNRKARLAEGNIDRAVNLEYTSQHQFSADKNAGG